MTALAGSPATRSGAYAFRAEGTVERSRPFIRCSVCDSKHEPTNVYEGLCSTCLDFEGSAHETHRVVYGGEA